MTSDSRLNRNRSAWEAASTKHVDEYREHLDRARNECSLFAQELDLLRPILAPSPAVVHLQSGHGLDDIALVDHGARSVVGVDFSQVAATAAQRRADELGAPCRYVVAELPGAPLRDACADLVYTGKGALIWLPDLRAWAADVVRLLRPEGHLFIYEAHPAVPLWTWDVSGAAVRGRIPRALLAPGGRSRGSSLGRTAAERVLADRTAQTSRSRRTSLVTRCALRANPWRPD